MEFERICHFTNKLSAEQLAIVFPWTKAEGTLSSVDDAIKRYETLIEGKK